VSRNVHEAESAASIAGRSEKRAQACWDPYLLSPHWELWYRKWPNKTGLETSKYPSGYAQMHV